MDKVISVYKRKVKYLRLELDSTGLKIIVPENQSLNIEAVLDKYKNWIDKKVAKLNELKESSKNLVLYNHQNFENLVNLYIEEIANFLNVRPNKVLFRKMKVRWGSCHHQKKTIILNKFLKFLPEKLIKYVVLHEMVHLIVPNHNKEFWLLIKKVDKNFKEKEKLLSAYRWKLLNENVFDNKTKI
jgi:predicted metal-dependent hydrolase